MVCRWVGVLTPPPPRSTSHTSLFVEAVIDSIQIWNREDDIETSNSENMDMRAVMYFQHEIMVQPMPEERPEVYDNGGEY